MEGSNQAARHRGRRPLRRCGAVACGLVVALCAPLASITAQPTPADARPSVAQDEHDALADSLAADAGTTSAGQTASAQATPAWLDVGATLDVAVAAFPDGEPLQFGAHDPTGPGFAFRQLELTLGANADPYFRFDAALVFGTFGVEIEEAYATTLALAGGLQLRAGQILTRNGRINPKHPHSWTFVDLPLVSGRFFGSEGSNGLGVEASWLTPLPWFTELVASATNAPRPSASGDVHLHGDEGDAHAEGEEEHAHDGEEDGAHEDGDVAAASGPGFDAPEDYVYTLGIRQFFPFDESWSVLLGLWTQLAPGSDGVIERSAIYGADLTLRYRPVDSPQRRALTWQTEVMVRDRSTHDEDVRDYGGYTQLVARVTPRWELGGRYELVGDPSGDELDGGWTRDASRGSALAAFYPSHFSRLRLQGSYGQHPDAEESVIAVFLNLEVTVGAHGAHEF